MKDANKVIKSVFFSKGSVRVDVISSVDVGTKAVEVVVNKYRWDKKVKKFIFVGKFTGKGGFKYSKDFNRDVAERAAIEVACDKEQKFEE